MAYYCTNTPAQQFVFDCEHAMGLVSGRMYDIYERYHENRYSTVEDARKEIIEKTLQHISKFLKLLDIKGEQQTWNKQQLNTNEKPQAVLEKNNSKKENGLWKGF